MRIIEYKTSEWNGFKRYDFVLNGKNAILIEPAEKNENGIVRLFAEGIRTEKVRAGGYELRWDACGVFCRKISRICLIIILRRTGS